MEANYHGGMLGPVYKVEICDPPEEGDFTAVVQHRRADLVFEYQGFAGNTDCLPMMGDLVMVKVNRHLHDETSLAAWGHLNGQICRVQSGVDVEGLVLLEPYNKDPIASKGLSVSVPRELIYYTELVVGDTVRSLCNPAGIARVTDTMSLSCMSGSSVFSVHFLCDKRNENIKRSDLMHLTIS